MKEQKGFLDRISPFSLILVMTIFTIVGAALIPRVNVSYEPSPEIKGQLSVSFRWDGASPRVLEQEVTSRIEGAVSSVKGVKSVNSSSNYGSGRISITLKDGVNISAVRFEISSLLKQIASKLPEGVSYPYLSGGSASTGRSSSKQLLSYRINANMRKDQIKEYADKNIKPYIEQMDNVAGVYVDGQLPQVLEVTYNPFELSNYGISVNDIRKGIENFLGQNSIVGDIEQVDDSGQKSRIAVRLESAHTNSDLREIPVATIDGKTIYLGSIATMSYKDRAMTSYFRINGLNTSYLNINIDENASIIAMSKKLRAEMDRITANLVEGYHVELIQDEAKAISEEINKLVRRTLLSLAILMLFVWLISRNIRYLSIIAITLLSNVLIAVILYYLFDVELHIFSLAGIAVSFGIIIDTSIVMVDHYSYYRNRKVFIAILAALLTTIGSLVVIFFMPKSVQEDLSDFSAIIIINLSVSLLVSLLFVPAIIDKYGYKSDEGRRSVRIRKRIVRISRRYKRYISFTQKRKWIYITIFILAFGLPVHLLPTRVGQAQWGQPPIEQMWYHDLYNKTFGGRFYQGTLKKPLEVALGGTLRLFNNIKGSGYRMGGEQEMRLNIRGAMPVGGTAEEMNEKVIIIENLLSEYKEIERFQTNINGRSASITVDFTEEAQKSSFPYALESDVISTMLSIGGVDWSTHGVSQRGFSNALNLTHKSYRISITGYNYDRLFVLAGDLVDKMKMDRRATDIEIQTSERRWDSEESLTEMYVKYDPKKVALYNFNAPSGYSSLNSILNSSDGGKYKDGTVESDILLVSDKRNDFDMWKLFNNYVNVGGQQIRYTQLAEIGTRNAKSSINKVEQEYSIAVAFNYLGSYEMSNKFVERMTEELNESLPIGFRTKSDVYNYNRDQEKQYRLIFLIIIIIFFVCTILFESIVQPLIIIALIPISYIGTFLTFSLSGVTFGTGGFASLVLLSGLVVNAAIYIINEYNNTRNRSVSGNKVSLYVKAYNHKIIPVFLTIISTVLGLIPFLMDGVKEQFWFSFAIGTAGGLLFSVIAIVFFMPILMPLKGKSRLAKQSKL